jgi:predicted acyl esterase
LTFRAHKEEGSMSRSSLRRGSVALFAVLSIVVALAPAAVGAPKPKTLRPFDYISLKDKLSKPTFPQTVRETSTVPMFDGETLYVEVVRPDPAVYGARSLPVILDATP